MSKTMRFVVLLAFLTGWRSLSSSDPFAICSDSLRCPYVSPTCFNALMCSSSILSISSTIESKIRWMPSTWAGGSFLMPSTIFCAALIRSLLSSSRVFSSSDTDADSSDNLSLM